MSAIDNACATPADIIERYLADNWGQHLDQIDRPIATAGLLIELTEAGLLEPECGRVSAAIAIARRYETQHGGWPQVVAEMHAALTAPQIESALHAAGQEGQ